MARAATGELGEYLCLAPTELPDLLQRWGGLSVHDFLHALTPGFARTLVQGAGNVLSQPIPPARDIFILQKPFGPAMFKPGGAGLTLGYGFHGSPFGEAILVACGSNLAALGFVDDDKRDVALDDMRQRWPHATWLAEEAITAALARRAFQPSEWRRENPLPVSLIGTTFERQVWGTLLRIPVGQVTTYGTIAVHIGRPTAARAVGAAVGKNPVSFVVPCHRVLGQSGALTGYHWGLARKQAMLAWEAGRAAS